MDSDSKNVNVYPKRLKVLASSIMYSDRNNLLHQFVLDNSDSNSARSENYINAILLSLAGTSINVNSLNNDGYSPLHLAVLKNNTLMVRKLLSCVANIDINRKCSFDRDENTALHLATQLGHLSIVQELLDKGADVDKKNVDGFTALCFAAELGNLDLMQMLVSKGADVNATCECGACFHYALRFHTSEDVKSYIRNGAALDFIDYENENILNYSTRSDPREFLVRRRGVTEFYRCKDLAPLHFAVRSNNMEALKFLINNGADLNVKDYFNDTLLHYAARTSDVATVAFLVSNGADINAKNMNGCTPLYYATKYNNVKTIKFLTKKKDTVNKNKTGHSEHLPSGGNFFKFLLNSGTKRY